MTRETWQVDGYALNYTLNGVEIRDIELNEGLYAPPAQVGANGTITNRTGELWRPKKHGPGHFVLNMFLAPPPQATATAARVLLDAAFDELYQAFQHAGRLMRYTRTLNSGEVRTCYGETISIAPAPIGAGNAGYRFAVEVNVPSGYWQSTNVVSAITAPATDNTRTMNLAPFAGSTAPLEDLVVTITGGVTNPRVQDTTDADIGVDGDWFQFYGTVPTDATLIVDCGNWTISGTGGLSIGGFAPSIGAITHKGGRFLTVEHPRPGLQQKVTMTCVNASNTCTLQVAGHKFFMV